MLVAEVNDNLDSITDIEGKKREINGLWKRKKSFEKMINMH